MALPPPKTIPEQQAEYDAFVNGLNTTERLLFQMYQMIATGKIPMASKLNVKVVRQWMKDVDRELGL